MLQVTHLGATSMTEAEAKKHFEAAVSSGNPAKYAAQAGAAAACGALAGPYAAALCALGAGVLFDKVFGGCAGKGGTLWCMEECTKIMVLKSPMMGMGPSFQCTEKRRIKPTPLAARKRGKLVCTPSIMAPYCCTKLYCQLPGGPDPLPKPKPDLHTPLGPLEIKPGRLLFRPRSTAPIVPEPTVPTKKAYPVGTLYYFEPKTRMYMVALPIGAGLGCVGNDYTMGLGQVTQFGGGETHTAPTPVAEKPEAPAQATTKTAVEKASGTQPIYKKWWFWTAIGAGALAAGTGTYIVRKRRE